MQTIDSWIVRTDGGANVESVLDSVATTLGSVPEVNHVFTRAINGFSVHLRAYEADIVRQIDSVSSVSKTGAFATSTDVGPAWISAPQIWDGAIEGISSTKGEGITIAVLDSGIDADNDSFAAIGPIDGYQHQNPLGSGNFLGLCSPSDPSFDASAQCNDKLIGIYDFTPSTAFDDPVESTHGSHTSSIAAGNELIVTLDNAEGDFRISGVAPHANIISYDVCSASGFCDEADIVAAVEQAIIDEVDVINMSLAGEGLSAIDDALLSAVDAGIFVAVAAGNGGAVSGTAEVPWVTSVGNITHDRVITASLSVTDFDPSTEDIIDIAYEAGVDVLIPSNLGPFPIVDAAVVDPGNNLGCDAFPAGTFPVRSH